MSGSSVGQWAGGMTLTRGLLGWYKQLGSLADASGLGNNYTNLTGAGLSNAAAATDKFGNGSRAWAFGGGSATVMSSTQYDAGRPLTYAMWMQPTTSVTQNAVIIGEGNSADDTSRVAMRMINRDIAISMVNASGTALIDETAATTNTAFLTVNTWSHIITSIDPVAGTYAIYVNGASAKTGTWSGTMTTLNQHGLGGMYGATLTLRSRVTVCDIRVYNRLLNDVEITSLATSSFRL